MKWRTSVDIFPTIEMGYESKILGFGSCFVENIGSKFREGKFDVHLNPFGILYNPISIVKALDRVIDKRFFEEEDLFLYQELWHSWEHHGCFSSTKKEGVLWAINEQISLFHEYLKTANYCIITLGSAYVYEHISSRTIVANCHKVPSGAFAKKRLDVEEIMSAFLPVMSRVQELNPNLEWVFTVSPVRHIRDGIIENQRSKAVLLLAVEKICKYFPAHYFPSYEIVLDELRDYRFYDRDLVHISPSAIDYIWEQFQRFSFSLPTQSTYTKVLKIVKGFRHRGLHPDTVSHQKFLQHQIKVAKEIQQVLPVDFSEEIAFCEQFLVK